MKAYHTRKRGLTSSLQSTLYNAYAGLGFKCSDCGGKKDLFIINRHGREAHLALKKQLGASWLWFIATNAEIRSLHKLVCKQCFFKLHASMQASKLAFEITSELDSLSSKQASLSSE